MYTATAPKAAPSSFHPCHPDDVITELKGMRIYLNRTGQPTATVLHAYYEARTKIPRAFVRLDGSGQRCTMRVLLEEVEPLDR